MGLTNFFRKQQKNDGTHHVLMEYSEITPSLFVGTNACCTAHYKAELIDKGVLHDVSLEGESLDAPFGVETFLWLPTEDHTPPTQDALQLGVNHLQKIFARKGRVYVHCKNGHGRGPTLAAAWFIFKGKTTKEAIDAVQKKRPEIHIEPAQRKALKKFEASLR